MERSFWHYVRFAMAILVAPAIASPAIGGAFLILARVEPRQDVFELYVGLGYAAALIFGAPAYLLLFRRRGWRKPWAYAAGGAAIGVAMYLVMMVGPNFPAMLQLAFTGRFANLLYALSLAWETAMRGYLVATIAAFYGAAAALVFWAMVIGWERMLSGSDE
jgi:hypothetical protein